MNAMRSEELTADILVPKEFVWWSFLALAADPNSPFQHIRFASQLDADSDVAIIDSRLLPQDVELLKKKQRIAVLLWDGYQSYLQLQPAIESTRSVARQFELFVVGDSAEIVQRHGISCRPLFPQAHGIYDRATVLGKQLPRFRFSTVSSQLSILHRSDLLSVKASWQLIASRRVASYRHTRFVYCGQSGIETLKSYVGDYGLMKSAALDPGLESEFLSTWLTVIHRHPQQWTNGIILRALLRVIALRRITKILDSEIFLNLYPEANVNAYQAGRLFRKHIFLDLGGINGDESVYPRSADILFHQRRNIRLDRAEALTRLVALDGSDLAGVESFLKWYAEFLESRLENCR